jgi:hypothetical protein
MLREAIESSGRYAGHPPARLTLSSSSSAQKAKPAARSGTMAIIVFKPVTASTLRTRGEVPTSTKRPAVSFVTDVYRSTKKPIPVDDNAVEAVIYKNEQAAKQLCESLHRSSPSVLVLTTRSSDRRPVVSKFQISLASSRLVVVPAANSSLDLANDILV